MKYLTQSIFCLSIATLAACSNETTSERNSTVATEEPVTTTDKAETTIQETTAANTETTSIQSTSYSMSLNADSDVSFDVKTTGQGTMRDMTVVAQKDGKELARITEPVEGTVANTVTTDLNKNQKPELLIFISGGGSGNYGTVYGYELARQDWMQLDLPPLTEEQREDYMGHDEFQVQGNQLLRIFPLYRDIDTNSNPTGGTRTITYSLEGTTFKATSSKDSSK
ncbi:hypothetical protein ACFSKU_20795 [Pontibacter silvestris]|uniref:Lipoprotein n=1 Tax=Pontibacter silvestris TaxID=2305183 RepID=A0ABW4X2Y2_9BACT|nr:hypothetical protein [Pontibacter silvestris]MCC9137141.1 hypothetical protein [Pontibacter silvestris]